MEDLATIFEKAVQMAPAARRDYLNQVCSHPDVRQQVEKMLSAAEKADAYFAAREQGGAESATLTVVPVSEGPGTIIGRYKLLQKIGEGGMGVVYMAEQEQPIRRRVALKIIKLGMDSRNVIARFEAERQALSMMDHPNIAKVLDAGTTETGRPFFVMELVKGIKITEYCDQNKLAMPERMRLLIQVCHAIQHAHQKGIIHRDIKPSNILVTLYDGTPAVKVIDFGIAKATQQTLTDKTLFTAFAQFIGTPAYMSPEQAELSALDIDTRSDIYSLGVLLYELLTGSTPFDTETLLRAGLDEVRRVIREKEPARPSTRLSTMVPGELAEIATRRQADPVKLTSLLHGELDWVVMKALEKDRSRRYESASELAADLQRHLNNEPVSARPTSNFYRFQKMVRRNKTVVAVAAALVASLVAGTFISTYMAVRAKRAEAAAQKARAEALAAAHQARYLAELERDTRLSLWEFYRDRLFADLLTAQPGKTNKVSVALEEGEKSGALLVPKVRSSNGKEVYVLGYSRELLQLIDSLSTAMAVNTQVPGTFSNYLQLCAQSQAVPEVPTPSHDLFKREDFKNERISNYNSLIGTLLAFHLQAHFNGYSQKYKHVSPEQLMNTLTEEEYGKLVADGARLAVESACLPEALRMLLRQLSEMEQRPWWAFVFVRPGYNVNQMVKVLNKTEADFFAGN